MLYSDKSKYAKHISKSVYGFGNINGTINTFKVRRKQEILDMHVKTLHLKKLEIVKEHKNITLLMY
jgi:hypothetical protein